MEAAARQRLVDEHLPLVRALATQVRRQLGNGVDGDDLVSYGVQGLLEAAGRYDGGAGASFATFAYYRIRGAIYDGVRRMGRLPRAEYARLRAAERAHDLLAGMAERDRGPGGAIPSADQDVGEIVDALAQVAVPCVVSLSATPDDEGPAGDAVPADEALAQRQCGARVRAVVAGLPERERHFIEKHYFEGKSLAEAGAELGL